MSMKWGWLALLAAQVVSAEGLQRSDVSGLQLQWDRKPQSVEVDGVPMILQRATGPDVAELVTRIQMRWRNAGSQTRELTHGGWRMLARWHGWNSEVMQWRGAGAETELLLSTFNTRIHPRVPAVPAQLPGSCLWGRQIRSAEEGHAYLQRTARCRGTFAELLPQLRASLLADGWTLTADSGSTLHAARGEGETALLLLSGRGHSEIWLVWISARQVGEAG
jgi:hypothetical protein